MAEKCHAFAKALHYKELEYASSADTAVEALISINNQLRQPEAAIGILTLAQTQLHMELKVRLPHLHLYWTGGRRLDVYVQVCLLCDGQLLIQPD